jgi:hypothetical protein
MKRPRRVDRIVGFRKGVMAEGRTDTVPGIKRRAIGKPVSIFAIAADDADKIAFF